MHTNDNSARVPTLDDLHIHLTVPRHLARYADEVEQWHQEALAARREQRGNECSAPRRRHGRAPHPQRGRVPGGDRGSPPEPEPLGRARRGPTALRFPSESSGFLRST